MLKATNGRKPNSRSRNRENEKDIGVARQLRRKEKHELYRKLTIFVGEKLRKFNNVEGWSDVEISGLIGIPTPRLTEIKHFEKYGRIINDRQLIRLLGGKIVGIEELKKEASLTNEEIDYLETFRIYEKPGLAQAIAMAANAYAEGKIKLSPEEILKEYLKRHLKE